MKLVGTEKLFVYPIEFKTLPDYTSHSGQIVKVTQRISASEFEITEALYEIKANDGWIGHAFESELV